MMRLCNSLEVLVHKITSSRRPQLLNTPTCDVNPLVTSSLKGLSMVLLYALWLPYLDRMDDWIIRLRTLIVV